MERVPPNRTPVSAGDRAYRAGLGFVPCAAAIAIRATGIVTSPVFDPDPGAGFVLFFPIRFRVLEAARRAGSPPARAKT